jgi:hypothetical protein
MRSIRRRRRLALFLGIGGLVALTAAGAAYALTASSFKYSSAKTGYVKVSQGAFAPDSSPSGGHTNSWTDGLSAAGGCLNAGFELPAGASSVKAVTFYYKSPAGSDFLGQFWATQLTTGEGLQLASAFPSNDADTPTSVTADVATINQPVTTGRAYGLRVCPGTDFNDSGAFYGAKIKYTYTSAGS